MFRLAEYERPDPNLYNYLSAIASETIFDAINGLFATAYDIEAFYMDTFSGSNADALFANFFHGLSEFISERSANDSTSIGKMISEDDRAGIELLNRKITRMKAKMLDPERFYTFDLFEELLFHIVIEIYSVIDEGEKPSEELVKKINRTMSDLKTRFDLGFDEAGYLAECIHRIERMDLKHGGLFFWDDDFSILFQDGFVSGIEKLISGTGSGLGYDYNDVCGIFTDIGIRAPLLMVGTEASYYVRRDATMEMVRQSLNERDDYNDNKLEYPFR